MTDLTKSEREQIAEILNRRANEISFYRMSNTERDKGPASVDFGLEREADRLRRLAERVNPKDPAPEDAND